MKRIITLTVFTVIAVGAFSQAKTRRFPSSINNPSINIFAPFISLDGSVILFTSDYSDEGPIIYVSQRSQADWTPPVALPRSLNTKLNMQKSYTLSPDGKTLYLTSFKSGGVGGYDIWFSTLKGTQWSEPQNIFAPINSKLHDSSPTFTPDGQTMYFMRCEKMDQQKASACKIFVSRRKPGGWEEPIELPAHINSGNSQSPRILGDGETLLFASDKILPNKGGLDIYVTKLVNGEWSAPVPLDVVNTDKDDQFVSVQANGLYALRDAPGKFKSEIIEYLIPEELRPRGVMKVEGMVTDLATATPAYISVLNTSTGKRVLSTRPNTDGSFFFYLVAGSTYELSIEHQENNATFYSKRYDLTGNPVLRNDKLQVTLKEIAAGDQLLLEGIQFASNSAMLENSEAELRRLSRLIKSSPHLHFEIQVLMSGYLEDVQPLPGLTEHRIDSAYLSIEKIDSAGVVFTQDSLVITHIYHNDRTSKQAQTIADKLTELGVAHDNISFMVNARPEAILENRRTIVQLVTREKK